MPSITRSYLLKTHPVIKADDSFLEREGSIAVMGSPTGRPVGLTVGDVLRTLPASHGGEVTEKMQDTSGVVYSTPRILRTSTCAGLVGPPGQTGTLLPRVTP